MHKSYDQREIRYQRFKRKNPGVSFARYLTERHFRNLSKGGGLNSSGALAMALHEPSAFWESGREHASRLFETMALEPYHRVIEYGCGSLRIGGHFVRYLNRGCFMGLDVISGFYEMGQTMLGPELLRQKAPQLAIIEKAALANAEAFKADRVYSNLVCVHVHPDETQYYFENLARLTREPGSQLIFNAEVSDKPLRFEFNCWAWPLEFYEAALKELKLVRTHVGRPRIKSGCDVQSVEFEFHR